MYVESEIDCENSVNSGGLYNYSTYPNQSSNPYPINSNWVTTDGTITIKGNFDDLNERISKLEGIDITTAFDYLDEDDLLHITDKLKERDFDYYKSFIATLVSRRHFSEEFLLRYAGDLSKEDIFKMHKAEILSQEYITLATRFALLGK